MLVLARKEGEVIRIGSDIAICITRIGKDSVRVGIDAPSELLVLREELVDGHLGAQLLKQQRQGRDSEQ